MELRHHGYQIDVVIGGRPFTTYYFDPVVAKPYLFPPRSAQGTVVTRSFPMVTDVAGEDHDEPHQRAMYCAHGDINGFDFWGEAAFPKWSGHSSSTFGRTVFRKLDAMLGGTDTGPYGPVEMGDTKEGMFAIRVVKTLDSPLNCAFEFDLAGGKRKMMEFEVRHWITNNEAGVGRGGLVAGKKRFFGHHNAIGNIFYGSNGYLATGDEDAWSYETWLGRDEKSGPHGHSVGDHFANFVDCVRSRKKEDLNAPIEEGHISCTLVHLANASYRLGRALRFDPETEQVIGDDEANNLLRDGDRGYRAPFAVLEEV